jgi:DNA-directed RNA polymerase subunit RPC12/RpoP
MSIACFCSTCSRDVHVGPKDELVCPVCSSPLLVLEDPTEDVPEAV